MFLLWWVEAVFWAEATVKAGCVRDVVVRGGPELLVM